MIISRRILFQSSKWKKLGSCGSWNEYTTAIYSDYYNCYVLLERGDKYSNVGFTKDFVTIKTISLSACINVDSKTGKVFYTDDSSGRATGGGFTSNCVIGYIDKNYAKKEQTIETVQPLGTSGWGSVDCTEICRLGNSLIFAYSTNARPTASGLGEKQNWAQKYAYSNDDGTTWQIVTLGHGENILNGDYDDIFTFGSNNGKYITIAEFNTGVKFVVFTSTTRYSIYESSISNYYNSDKFYLNGTWYITSSFGGYKSTDGHTFTTIPSSQYSWLNKSTIYLAALKKYLSVKSGSGIRLYDESFNSYKELSFPNKNKLKSLLGVFDGIAYVRCSDNYIYLAPLEDLIK